MKEANRIRQQTLTKETAGVQDAIKIATYLSKVAQMMTWTRLKSKKKIWIECVKRSTRDAEDKMRAASISSKGK